MCNNEDKKKIDPKLTEYSQKNTQTWKNVEKAKAVINDVREKKEETKNE